MKIVLLKTFTPPCSPDCAPLLRSGNQENRLKILSINIVNVIRELGKIHSLTQFADCSRPPWKNYFWYPIKAQWPGMHYTCTIGEQSQWYGWRVLMENNSPGPSQKSRWKDVPGHPDIFPNYQAILLIAFLNDLIPTLSNRMIGIRETLNVWLIFDICYGARHNYPTRI